MEGNKGSFKLKDNAGRSFCDVPVWRSAGFKVQCVWCSCLFEAGTPVSL